MSATFMPQEISRFQEWLKDKQSYVSERVSTAQVKQIVGLVFEILDAELNYEFENADREISTELSLDKME